MERNRKLQFIGLFVILSLLTCFIMPHGDDWLYLNYFNNNWNINRYNWVNNCIFLPRNFWRPWEDCLGKYVIANFPFLFPYVNHIIITLIHVLCGYFIYKLCLKFKYKEQISFYSSIFFVFATTSMGGLLSVDSIAQVLTTFWGLLSILAFVSNKKYGKFLWMIFGIFCILSKESGFIWMVVGPVVGEFIYQKQNKGNFHFNRVRWLDLVGKILIAIIPIIIYFVIYINLSPSTFGGIGMDNNVIEENAKSFISLDNSYYSYHLTILGFFKNVAVLFLMGIFPVDSSAIYYHSWTILGTTLLLSIFGLCFIFRSIKIAISRNNYEEVVLLLLITIWISCVSLLTTAGEISPHPSNAFFAILLASFFDNCNFRVKYKTLCKIGFGAFIVSTLVVDIHKYYLAYQAGIVDQKMGEFMKSNTTVVPNKVLSICVRNPQMHKTGAFISNPSYDYSKGAPVVFAYGCKYPKEMDIVQLEVGKDEPLKQKIDSIVNVSKGKNIYNCIWIQNEKNLSVINLK